MKELRWIIFVIIVMVQVFARCGGDDSSSLPPPRPRPTWTLTLTPTPTPIPIPTPTPMKPDALLETLTISYAGAADWLISLAPEDHSDQILDWALLGLAEILNLDVETLRYAFYDQMPIRDPIFYDIMANPVGPGRALPDQDGNLHILLPMDEELYPDRAIGMALDDYRKNSGITPSWVLLYRYTIDHELREVLLYPESTASLQEIHDKYGFVEMELDSLGALEAFLVQTTHLSYLELRGNDLWAGGWQWSNLDKNLITAEDLTVLQEGYREYADALRFDFLTDQQKQAWEFIKKLETTDETDPEYNKLLKSDYVFDKLLTSSDGILFDKRYLSPTLLDRLTERVYQELRFILSEELINQIIDHESYIRTLNEPGFSLDPGPSLTIDELLDVLDPNIYSGLHEYPEVVDFAVSLIEADSDETLNDLLYSDIVSEVLSIPQPKISYEELFDQGNASGSLTTTESITVGMTITGGGLQRFMDELDAIQDYEDSIREKIDELIGENFYRLLSDTNRGRSPYQAARYDGGTRGTEVGMTLYYTDLVAKGWKQEKGESGPTGKVPGFISDLAAKTPWGHCTMSEESGRLWFGLRKEAVSVNDHRVNLGSIATQVFTLIDNPDGSESEVEPSYSFGRLIWWWDRHYLAMADYEPQYHRLDQLMRWGAALAWLVEQDSTLLPEVPESQIQRDLRFDEWLTDHAEELKWSYDVPFVNPPGVETEALLVLYSQPRENCGMTWISSGGISGPGIDEVLGIFSNPRAAMPRSAVIDIGTEAGKLDDITGTIQRGFEAITDNKAIINTTAEGRKVWPFGSLKIEVSDTTKRVFSQNISRQGGKFNQKLMVQGEELGNLSVIGDATSATIQWKPSLLDRTRNLASGIQNKLAQSGTTLNQAVSEAAESTTYIDDLGRAYIPMQDGTDLRWMIIQDELANVVDDGFAFRLTAPHEWGGVTSYTARLTDDVPTLTLENGKTTARWLELAPPQAEDGSILIRGIGPPEDSALTQLIIELDKGDELAEIFTDGATVATKVDDPLFGLAGKVDPADFRAPDGQWHTRVQAVVADSADDGARKLRYQDGKAWIVEDIPLEKTQTSKPIELGQFFQQIGVNNPGGIRGPPTPTYFEGRLAAQILEEGRLLPSAIESPIRVRVVTAKLPDEKIGKVPGEILLDDTTEWILPWTLLIPSALNEPVAVLVIEEERCLELIGAEGCQIVNELQ